MTQHQTIPTESEAASHMKADRKQDMHDWNRDIAKALADEEGIEMTEDHWEVIVYLRRRYLENGLPESAREITMELAKEFSGKGGNKFLYKLFPGGAVTQGSHIAGLPTPRHNEDASFGTAF